MKELLKNFFAYGFASASEKIISFLLLPILARLYNVTEFGVIDLIQSFISIISVFSFLQLETSIQRYYYRMYGQIKGMMLFSSILFMTALGVLLSLIIGFNADFISKSLCGTKVYADEICLAGIQIPFIVLSSLLLIILRYEGKNRLFILISILKALLIGGGCCIYIYIIDTSVLGFFIAQLYAFIIISIISIIVCRKFLKIKFSTRILSLMLRYALPQFPARLGSIVNTYANKFFISGYVSLYALGIFSMSYRIATIMSVCYQIFMMAWNQFIFKQIQNDSKKIIPIILEMITPIVCMIILVVSTFSYEIIYYIIGPEYIAGTNYVGFLMLGFSFLIFKEIVDIGPKILCKTYLISINFFVSMVINIILLYILIPNYGVIGAVIALLLSNIVLFLMSLYNSQRIYILKFNYKSFIINILLIILLMTCVNIINQQIFLRTILLFIGICMYIRILVKATSNYNKLVKK